jgi:hypothetical protein
MGKLLIKLLDEARGNAVWDTIVRICQWGWPAMLTVLTWLVGWFKHAPMWQVWIAVGFVCFVCYTIAILVNRMKDKNQVEKTKCKTKEERNKELIDKIARCNLPHEALIRNREGQFSAHNEILRLALDVIFLDSAIAQQGKKV